MPAEQRHQADRGPVRPAEPSPLSVDCARDGALVTVRVTGDVDYSTAPLLADGIRDAVLSDGVQPARVVLGLAEVRFLDSSGVATLLEAKRMIEDFGGSLTLVSPSQAVARTLELAGLVRLFGL